MAVQAAAVAPVDTALCDTSMRKRCVGGMGCRTCKQQTKINCRQEAGPKGAEMPETERSWVLDTPFVMDTPPGCATVGCRSQL